MKTTQTFAIATLLMGLVLAGCAPSYKPDIYREGQAQQAMRVRFATVIDIRPAEITARNTGTGAAVGAAAGGVAAGRTGDKGGVLAGIAGAVVGGVVGHAVEKSANTRQGVEITYRLDDTGETQALVQEQDEKNPIMKGDRIRILQGRTGTRAERD